VRSDIQFGVECIGRSWLGDLNAPIGVRINHRLFYALGNAARPANSEFGGTGFRNEVIADIKKSHDGRLIPPKQSFSDHLHYPHITNFAWSLLAKAIVKNVKCGSVQIFVWFSIRADQFDPRIHKLADFQRCLVMISQIFNHRLKQSFRNIDESRQLAFVTHEFSGSLFLYA
jgi:hypothetical protein